MKRTILFIFVVICLFNSPTLMAGHALGADIYYLNPDQDTFDNNLPE